MGLPGSENRFFVTDASWHDHHPGACAGILIIQNINNIPSDAGVDALKARVERMVRDRFAGFSREQMSAVPTIAAYADYYKKFGKTYHVLPQVESIVGGKSLPAVSAVLGVMFAHEVKNMLLTAGHDLGTLALPLRIFSASGDETYLGMGDKAKQVAVGDMAMADGTGVISSIIQGPDARTKITPETSDVLFAVYGVPGIARESVALHLQEIRDVIMSFSSDATVLLLQIFEA